MSDTQIEVLNEWQLTRPVPDGVKLTPAVVRAVMGNIARGNYIEQSCIAAGISSRTWRRWLERAKNEPDSVYAEFAEMADRACALAEQRLVRFVNVAAKDPKNWAAAMTLLERRHPERWGRKDRVHSTVDAVHKLVIQWGDVTQDNDGNDDQDDYVTSAA